MTESRNGTQANAPRGERGISIAENLSLNAAQLPFSIRDYGLEDFNRPWPKDLEEMVARDGMARALYYLLTFLVGDAPVHIEGEGPKADHVRKNLLGDTGQGGMKTPIGTVLKQMSMGIVNKRQPFEKVWSYEGGKTWLTKLKALPVSTCRMVPDRRGNFDGFVQHSTQGILAGEKPVKFPPEKAFVYIHDGAERPLEGRSALGAAWHEYQNKLKARHLTHLYLQGTALPIKHATTRHSNEQEQRSLQNRVEKTDGGGTVITGPEETLEIVSGGSTNEFVPYLSFINREMALSTLMQWLQVGGSEGGGSYNLSRDHSSFTVSQADGTLRQMGEDLTRYVVSDMIRYNFAPDSPGDDPAVKLGPISENDRQVALEMYKTLATAPASRVSDDVYQKIQEKALQSMDIEADEDTDTAPAQPEASVEDDDELERARRIVRGESS